MQSRRTPFVVALTALVLAAPAAQAKPGAPENWRAVSDVSVADTEAQVLASRGQGAPVPEATGVESADAGFDWGTAAVGGGVALAVLGSLGAAGVSARGGIRTAR
jgi:hypothetical protein